MKKKKQKEQIQKVVAITPAPPCFVYIGGKAILCHPISLIEIELNKN